MKDEGNCTRTEEINEKRNWWRRKRKGMTREKERERGREKGERGR